jgi:hypothetical protein
MSRLSSHRVIRSTVVVAALLMPSCWWTNGDDELGLTARLRIVAPTVLQETEGGTPPPGAQFFPGALPKPSSDGPVVTDVDSLYGVIYPGELNRAISGRVADGTVVVAIGLQGDIGYWVLPVGTEDFQYPGEIDFTATGQFSDSLPIGSVTLQYEAGDGNGHYGQPNNQVLRSEVIDSPHGYLIVHLTWDTESDLDLHVEDPNGDEIWPKAETTFTPPAPGMPPATPMEIMNAGIMQWDSNGLCVIDGFRAENVYWPETVPAGVYTVRVDAWSMCGQQEGNWTVSVEQRSEPTVTGTILATATGTLYPRDATLSAHTGASGTFALSFTIPQEEGIDAGP